MPGAVWVIHGPNLNLLGRREPHVYGRTTLAEIDEQLARDGGRLGLELTLVQRNGEEGVVEAVHQAWEAEAGGILINPGALAHHSLSLRDALAAVAGAPIPVVEVHLTNVQAREGFRHRLVTAGVVAGVVMGFGPDSYRLGLEALARLIRRAEG